MQTLESLTRKINGAGELKSIVRTMKAMSASNIGQYEAAVNSLENYYTAIAMGILVYLEEEKVGPLQMEKSTNNQEGAVCAIVFGSDQGFVGQFNNSISEFVARSLDTVPGRKEVWTVGARIPLLLKDAGLNVTRNFSLPNSINAITSLISSILINVEDGFEHGRLNEVYIFYNSSKKEAVYTPVMKRLLPFDEKWRKELNSYKWPGKQIPEIIGKERGTVQALISQYLFVTVYKACAESMASENYSRLGAMQRAEKNIEKLLDETKQLYHHLRQSSIDEELFDVVSGFEAFRKSKK
ncbi:MAG: F0F1 ATP synthase subunit gamma [Cyclobacteriaceae bacterium]